jgi:hypothetical protein
MASQLLMHWAQSLDSHPERVSLPLSATSGEFSFHDLAREAVKHVHPRAVLDELIRLGLAREAEGMVFLLAEAFVPEGARDELMALWAGNARAMLATGVHNVRQAGEPQLERAIWGEGISEADALAVQTLARTQWAAMQSRLHEQIASSAQVSKARHRVRVGVYARVEPIADDTDPQTQAPSGARKEQAPSSARKEQAPSSARKEKP